VVYIESNAESSDIRQCINELKRKGTAKINFIDPTDSRLEKRLRSAAASTDIQLNRHENPLFLNTREENAGFFKPAKKNFYRPHFTRQNAKNVASWLMQQ
jgi:deoxyribodipyrimidine photolyase-like uncharacterized protein